MNEDNIHQQDTDEVSRSLKLVLAQISMSMKESDESMNRLIDAISAMTGSLQRIGAKLDNCAETSDTIDHIKNELSTANQGIQEAVMAFQFYDRLTQRITHVEENLEAISELVSRPEQQHPGLWKNLESKLSSVYSFEQEQKLYQALLQGISKAEAMEQPLISKPAPSPGEVELF
jgi:septation ring formation regulator EzrA